MGGAESLTAARLVSDAGARDTQFSVSPTVEERYWKLIVIGRSSGVSVSAKPEATSSNRVVRAVPAVGLTESEPWPGGLFTFNDSDAVDALTPPYTANTVSVYLAPGTSVPAGTVSTRGVDSEVDRVIPEEAPRDQVMFVVLAWKLETVAATRRSCCELARGGVPARETDAICTCGAAVSACTTTTVDLLLDSEAAAAHLVAVAVNVYVPALRVFAATVTDEVAARVTEAGHTSHVHATDTAQLSVESGSVAAALSEIGSATLVDQVPGGVSSMCGGVPVKLTATESTARELELVWFALRRSV
mmetsp:Transcript_11926/g.27483  ORF Transcript_11926/g.27483 Transcript_11926/m.27483 type:complete len:303 (-) Transcript_11926:1777-2685(-)